MTIYLIALFGLMLYGGCANHNLTDRRKKRYILIAFTCLTVIAMLRSYNVGRDLQDHYYKTFMRVVNIDWQNLFDLGYENGYLVFYKIISMFTDNGQWMIAIHSLFVIGITGWFIYRNSDNVVISTFLFITTNTWFMYMTMMRQSMAVCIVLIGLEVWKNKKLGPKRYIIYYLIVILALQFHSSAVIAVFIPFFDFLQFKRKHIFFSIIAMLGAFVLYNQIFSALSILSVGKRDYTEFYSSSGAAINIISVYFVLLYVTFFLIGAFSLAYYGKRERYGVEIESENNKYSDNFLLYMALSLAVCRIVGLKINIVARMTYYFMPFIYVLIPRAISRMRVYGNRKVIKWGLYVVMTMAFIWLGYKSASSLYGTVPYTFFWDV